VVILVTSFRARGTTISIVGNATAQLFPHATIQASKKFPVSGIALKVETPDTTHDISPDTMKANKIGAAREGIIILHLIFAIDLLEKGFLIGLFYRGIEKIWSCKSTILFIHKAGVKQRDNTGLKKG